MLLHNSTQVEATTTTNHNKKVYANLAFFYANRINDFKIINNHDY